MPLCSRIFHNEVRELAAGTKGRIARWAWQLHAYRDDRPGRTREETTRTCRLVLLKTKTKQKDNLKFDGLYSGLREDLECQS